MKSLESTQAILITVSGVDTPGITAELTKILAQQRISIMDIGQAVIHGLLSLSILFEVTPQIQHQDVLKDLLFKANELGLKLDFRVMETQKAQSHHLTPNPYRYAITLIAEPLSANAVHLVSEVLARHRVNIDSIERLSESRFRCVEMIVSSRDEINRSELKKDLLSLTRTEPFDIALQAEGLYRRSKRLVAFDMDSTLIQNEVIDELAKEKNVYTEVAQITEKAMRGELDFHQALIERVALLRGLSIRQIDNVLDRIQLTPGASGLIKVLKKLGYKTAVISGGFDCVVDFYREKLGLDYAYSNKLEVKGGILTGNVIPPIVTAQRKADLLEVIAQQERIHLDQVIAIGDGANDLLMLEKAGLGIAFNAKPMVRDRADFAISQKNLENILYLLGISGRDLQEVLS